jgi:hypothetical protein
MLRLLVGIGNGGRGREFGKMHVIDVADGFCYVPKIVLFRKARKLRDVVQADVSRPTCW